MKKLFVSALAIMMVYALSVDVSHAKKAPKAIRIGGVLSATGMFAGFGQGTSFGVKAAVEDINKLGGVYVKEYGKKIPIKLIIADRESDVIKARTVSEHLVLRDKVHFLVSPMEPPPMVAQTAMIAEKYKVPHVGVNGPMEPWLGMRNSVDKPWEYTWTSGFAIVVPVEPGDFRHGKPGYTILDTWMAMLDKFGDKTNKKVGVFASDEPDGRGWWALFGPELKKLGYDVLGHERKLGLFPLGTTDFSSVVKEWKDYGVEIIWGNSPGPDFGVLWRQAHAQGLKPKMVGAARAALFYEDVVTWGGDLPLGVGIEMWWHPSYTNCPGFGNTTPRSLFERWQKKTGKPLNQAIGHGYFPIQVIVDAIERAGTLDREAVNKALASTDLLTINHRVVYDKKNHFSRIPLFFGQWMKTDKPWKWDLKVVFSKHDFVKEEAKPLFPIP